MTYTLAPPPPGPPELGLVVLIAAVYSIATVLVMFVLP